MRPATTVATLLTVLLLVTGCGGGAREGAGEPVDGRTMAEAMIADDLAEAAGLGRLRAVCDDPGPLALGSTFTCTGLSQDADSDGPPLEVRATVGPDGRLALATTNLITAAALPGFERAVADDLRSKLGSSVSPDDVDCGAGPVVLAAGGVLVCTLTRAERVEPLDLTVNVVDLDARRVTAEVTARPGP